MVYGGWQRTTIRSTDTFILTVFNVFRVTDTEDQQKPSGIHSQASSKEKQIIFHHFKKFLPNID